MNELEKQVAKLVLARELEKRAFVGKLVQKAVTHGPQFARNALMYTKNLPTRIRRKLSPSFRAKQDRQMMELRGRSGRFKPDTMREQQTIRNYLAAGGTRTVTPEAMAKAIPSSIPPAPKTRFVGPNL